MTGTKSDQENRVVAIIPAAGTGKRFGDRTNKPLELLNGKPLIIWALETLEAMPEIKEIIPVLKESDMEYGADLFEEYRISKIRRIAPGGKERQDSVFHGVKLIDDKKCIVLVHDGARPLIETDIIREALKQMKDCDGVVVAVPVKDTIKEVSGGIIKKTLKRNSLWSVQTPQIFPFKTLYNAYEKAMQDSFYSTDDSALVEKYGGKIKIAEGSYSNIKITTPEDMKAAEIILSLRTGKK
jgi:2-C-methyl-D-erythritol 4-phosphate cytidylyltransferase